MENGFQKYKLSKEKSLIFNVVDDYKMSVEEYYFLHMFYLTHTLASSESNLSFSYIEYGWNSNSYLSNGAKKEICKLFDLENENVFMIASETNDLKSIFSKLKLTDNEDDYSFERVGIANQKGSNRFEKLLILIRNCLAHGAYRLKYYDDVKMVIMQDQKDRNVTGRAIIKLSTLLSIAKAIDKNGLLQK